MAEQLFSGSWYRVKNLTPRLRAHSQIHRHVYRGETWYVMRDPANERFHRFTPAANYVIGLLNGERSVEDIWNLAGEELGDDAPTQDETIRLLGQLHAADVLQSDVPPDARELFERWEKREKGELKNRLLSPFSIRVPLVDPERFLSAGLNLVRPLFSWQGAVLWLLVVLPATVLAGVHWSELTENLLDRLLTPENLVMVWLIFPLIKVLHELGHGFAAKAFGGEIHDMGVMFLVFTPVPYVDASSSWAFASKYKRALVGAGGMLVEIFIAALAFYFWLAAEPGALRSVAYNVMIIAGLTTLLFNANPLLRFDGYYILSDLTEIPNLRARANAYCSYLCQRYLFGNEHAEHPQSAEGENVWFVVYPIASFVYRMVIMVAIFSWILEQFLFVGLVLGLFAAVGWVGLPVYKAIQFLSSSPSIHRVRGRAWAVSGGLAGLVLILVLAVPVPLRSMNEGVVWIPEESFVRPGVEGFVVEVVAEPDSRVRKGDLLIRTHDPVVAAEQERLEARVHEFEALYGADRVENLANAAVTLEELRYAKKQLQRLQEKSASFEIRSHTDGRFIMARAEDLPGRFVRQGQLLAHVIELNRMTVRAIVDQNDADLVRNRTSAVDVRMAERLQDVYSAEILRLAPSASEQLPSMALGSAGGGHVPTDPSDPEGGRSVITVFEVELVVETDAPVAYTGGRVYVRFDHGTEPLGAQIYRRMRQVFLSRFQV